MSNDDEWLKAWSYTIKCRNCHARFKKPPLGWDCPLCLRNWGRSLKCWQPDDEAPTCGCCSVNVEGLLVGLLNVGGGGGWGSNVGIGRESRHHCRNCGRVTCGKCTEHKASIPALGFDSPVRVCTQCVSELPRSPGGQGGGAVPFSSSKAPPVAPTTAPEVPPTQPLAPVAGSGSAKAPPVVPSSPPNAVPQQEQQPQRQFRSSDFSIDFNSQLGAGGSATVYKAFDNVTNKPVAVKVQPVGSLDAEAKLLTQLHHPNIVQVLFFDDGTVGSSAAAGPPASKLFLELVDGGSLDKLIESSAPLPEEEIRRYLSAILQALDCVHTQSPPMCHRDVKPANMLLTKDGTLKLTDFGCARVQGKTGTTATLIAGTWVCLAPEACVGKPCAASDLWATACSVVHMASGRTAWHETGLNDFTLGTHISKPNPPLNHYPIVPQTLSAPLQALLRKMFAQSTEHRGTAASHLKDPYFTDEIPSNPAPTAGGGSVAASAFPQWLLDLEVEDEERNILLQNKIDEKNFLLLDSDDIKEMGIALGPRKVLLEIIARRKNV